MSHYRGISNRRPPPLGYGAAGAELAEKAREPWSVPAWP